MHTYPIFFFFNDTATTEIYTLSLHDALPILSVVFQVAHCVEEAEFPLPREETGRVEHAWAIHQAETTVDFARRRDRKSTRLNSSHSQISYAVFCLKKKTNTWVPTLADLSCVP